MLFKRLSVPSDALAPDAFYEFLGSDLNLPDLDLGDIIGQFRACSCYTASLLSGLTSEQASKYIDVLYAAYKVSESLVTALLNFQPSLQFNSATVDGFLYEKLKLLEDSWDDCYSRRPCSDEGVDVSDGRPTRTVSIPKKLMFLVGSKAGV